MNDNSEKRPGAEVRIAALEEAAREFRHEIASCERAFEESAMARDAIIDALAAIVVAAAGADGDFMARFQLALNDRKEAYEYFGEPSYINVIAKFRALSAR